jgi:hypothetical protein
MPQVDPETGEAMNLELDDEGNPIEMEPVDEGPVSTRPEGVLPGEKKAKGDNP